MERVSSFKYLGVNISEDLTWTTHIQTQVKKARQRLYHLRQLRKFRVSPAILKTFYSGAIESVSNHPSNSLFSLLPSGKRFRSMMAKTERLRRSFFPQAPKLKLCLITFTGLNLINCKIFTILIIRIVAMCMYPVQPVCTFLLHIPVYIIIY